VNVGSPFETDVHREMVENISALQPSQIAALRNRVLPWRDGASIAKCRRRGHDDRRTLTSSDKVFKRFGP